MLLRYIRIAIIRHDKIECPAPERCFRNDAGRGLGLLIDDRFVQLNSSILQFYEMTPLSSPSPPPVPGFSGASGVVGVSPLLGSTLPLPCVMSSSSSSMTLPFLSTFCHETELANSSEYFGETQDKPKDGHYPRCDAKIRKKDHYCSQCGEKL